MKSRNQLILNNLDSLPKYNKRQKILMYLYFSSNNSIQINSNNYNHNRSSSSKLLICRNIFNNRNNNNNNNHHSKNKFRALDKLLLISSKHIQVAQ